MKKILSLILILASFQSIGQRTITVTGTGSGSGAGGKGVISFGKNAAGDSTVLTLADGTRIATAIPSSPPLATASVPGLVTVGGGLTVTNGIVSATSGTSVVGTISTAANFTTFNAAVSILMLTDSLQGGQFKLYSGPDSADGGMIFKDQLNRRWLRITHDEEIFIKWYGIRTYNNYGFTDDAIKIRQALDYIYKHRAKFGTLVLESCRFNEWYYIGSTIYLRDHVKLRGQGGVKKAPSSRFQLAAHTTGIRIPAGAENYVEVKDLLITAYADANVLDSSSHGIDIHTVVSMDNVFIREIPNGNGFNLDACAYALPSDTINFGNADQAKFVDCFGDQCGQNGFYIEGCDANVIGFMDCSASSNRRWGVYDNGLLGNHYWNLHLANNGKAINTGATLTIDGVVNAATYFLRATPDVNGDPANSSINQRPDLNPAIWYKNDTGLGVVTTWDSTRKYWSSGSAWAGNPNAKNVFIGTYTESFSPANILSSRSSWSGGLDGALVIGGVKENALGGFKFFSSGVGDGEIEQGGVSGAIIATKRIRLQTTSIINSLAEADIVFPANSSKLFLLPETGQYTNVLASGSVLGKAGAPTTADVPENQFRIYVNYTTGLTYLYANNSGTLLKVQLTP